MKIYVLNGPNLNLLGVREPGIYGSESYDTLIKRIEAYAKEKGVSVKCLQSNHEGALVDFIHEGFYERIDGIVFNPGAYTHTSIALLDALKATDIPTVEVHISDVNAREEFRRQSYIRPACIATVSGHGTNGYLEAIDLLLASQAEVAR
ncbi:MAG: type II 3-dehydroquinate dehydratase [Ruminococcaceae bacterium]|nr:type II 3-dehydroquinate dehydratase [Oscillospiraceae bacterium]